MRIANAAGRACLVHDDRVLDVHDASDGRFGPDPQGLFEQWDAFVAWADGIEDLDGSGRRLDLAELGPPVPRPAQVFAIGINYSEHAREAGYPTDALPVTFTKFPTCLTGPEAVVALPDGSVDWEVELVVALARRAERVPVEQAWDYVAGLTVGQDLSERQIQLAGAKPQFSLGKSFPGFGPTGPWLVTPDELETPDDLEISCMLSGEVVQSARTSQMVYPVAELIARLSGVCTLLPGDLIFTGTPAGVGNARTPKRFITPEDVLVSRIGGIGSMTTRFTA